MRKIKFSLYSVFIILLFSCNNDLSNFNYSSRLGINKYRKNKYNTFYTGISNDYGSLNGGNVNYKYTVAGKNKNFNKNTKSNKCGGGYYKVGSAYRIEGKTYKPREYKKYSEVGLASWYGDDFHNKKTANGEYFNMNEITAAHKTLPLPSIVMVTNLETGDSAVVRVNDRGPFVDNRIIDLSKAAAEELGFKKKGVIKVKIELLTSATEKYLKKCELN